MRLMQILTHRTVESTSDTEPQEDPPENARMVTVLGECYSEFAAETEKTCRSLRQILRLNLAICKRAFAIQM